MLTYDKFVNLHRTLRTERVLSAYIAASASDPADQRAWRTEIMNALRDMRASLGNGPAQERSQFEACAEQLREECERLTDGIGAPGWAVFVSVNGVVESHPLPVRVNNLVVWSQGMCVAPYVRALTDSQASLVVVGDSRHTNIHRYVDGHVELIEKVHADHAFGELPFMSGPSSLGFNTGVHGEAGHDAAERGMREARDKMLDEVCAKVKALVETGTFVLVGGIHRTTSQLVKLLRDALPPDSSHLVVEIPLDVNATDAQISEAAAHGVSELRATLEAQRIADVTELAGANGLGVLGAAETRRALGAACVRELYLTPTYLDTHVAEAEEAVRSALDQSAHVEEVSAQAAVRLDGRGGIAASLRFRPAIIDDPAGAELRPAEIAAT